MPPSNRHAIANAWHVLEEVLSGNTNWADRFHPFTESVFAVSGVLYLHRDLVVSAPRSDDASPVLPDIPSPSPDEGFVKQCTDPSSLLLYTLTDTAAGVNHCKRV